MQFLQQKMLGKKYQEMKFLVELEIIVMFIMETATWYSRPLISGNKEVGSSKKISSDYSVISFSS